uniref:U7 snRNA-associated Sm-like protein LSm11 n=1 Tax=Styela clava TaxID=7725 RepID=UPI00193A0F91|nr:U7 snRNA-associated Sm-like protein LSm11 [Styela clava]
MSTDPTSSDFDPLLALYSSDNEPQTSDVKVFDNIAMFEGSLKRQQHSEKTKNAPGSSKRSQKSFSQRKRMEEEARNRDLRKLKEFMEMRKKIDRGEKPEDEKPEKKVRSQRTRTRKTLFTSMEKLSEGPYSLIHRIVREHLRCNVYVRDFCGLRGVCSGYVVAFDRFTNLAMVDVDETFRKPPLGKVADHQKQLTVASLMDAMKNISLGNTSSKVTQFKKTVQHRATTGVQIVATASDKKKPSTELPSSSETKIKVVGKDYFKPEVFHGGTPQLYHRHLDNLFVRGDSIVLVSLK